MMSSQTNNPSGRLSTDNSGTAPLIRKVSFGGEQRFPTNSSVSSSSTVPTVTSNGSTTSSSSSVRARSTSRERGRTTGTNSTTSVTTKASTNTSSTVNPRNRSTSRSRTSSGSSTSLLLNLDDGSTTVSNDPNIVVKPGPAVASLMQSGINLNPNVHGTYTTVPINIAASAVMMDQRNITHNTTSTNHNSSQHRTSTGSTRPRERSLSNGGQSSSNSTTQVSSNTHKMVTTGSNNNNNSSLSVNTATASVVSSNNNNAATSADGTVARETLIVVQKELASVRTSLRDMEREKENDRHQYLRMIEDNRKISVQLKQSIQQERSQFTKQIESINTNIKHEQQTFQTERNTLHNELHSAITGATEREANVSSALASAQARIEGLLRDAAVKDTLSATTGSGVTALQTALHQALKLQNNELVFYKQQNEIFQQNNNNFTTVLDQQTQQTMENLRNRITDLEGTVRSSTTREQELSTIVRTVQNNMNEYQLTQQNTLLTIHHQQQDKDDIIQTIANSSKIAMESAKNEVVTSRKVHDTVLQELEQIKNQLHQVQYTQQQRIDSLGTELRTVVEASNTTKQALQQQIQQYQKENQALVLDVQQQRNETLDIQARSSQMEAELRRAVATANETATEAVRIRDTHDANAVHEITTMAQKLSDIETSSSALQKEMTGIIDDLRAALGSAEEAQIKARIAESSRHKQLESNWEAERNVWKQRIENNEKSIQTKDALLLQLRTESDTEIQRLRQQLVNEQQQHQSDIETLKQEYNDMEQIWSKKVDQRQARIDELENEIQDLTKRLNQACTIRDRLSLDAIPDYVLNSTTNLGNTNTNGLSSSMLRTIGTSYVNETRNASLPLSPLSPSSSVNNLTSPSQPRVTDTDTSDSLLPSLSHQVQQVHENQASLLSLAQRFGACALSVAWTSQRSLTNDLQTSLVKTYETLLKSMKASNNPSELVRTQLQLELRSLRTAYNETNTLLYNTKKAWEESKTLSSTKEDEHLRQIEQTEEATVRLTSALANTLRTVETLSTDLQRERNALVEKDKQSYKDLETELTNARQTIDTLQAQTINLIADTQRICAAHAAHQKEEIESLHSSAKVLQSSYEASTKTMENESKLQQERYNNLHQQYQQLQSTHHTEILTLQTQAKAVQNILEHTRSTIQERQASFSTREQALLNELSRLAAQSSVIDADANMRINASRENFTRALENNIDSLNQELARTRETIPVLLSAMDTKGAQYSNQIQTFTHVLQTLVKFMTENTRLNQTEGQIFTTLISFIHQYAVDLLAKSHNHRMQLQADIDSLRNKLAGTDANSWSRISALLSRSQMILQRIGQSIVPNQTGSIASAPEVAVLQALVDRLSAMEHTMSGSNNNDPNQPKAEIQRLTSTLTAERTEADVREQAYLAEMERIRQVLDRYRDTALHATASTETATNQIIQTVSTVFNTLNNTNNSNGSLSSILMNNNNNRTVLPGHGLTSPQLAMRNNPSQTTTSAIINSSITTNGSRSDVPDPTTLPIPHLTTATNKLFSPDGNTNNTTFSILNNNEFVPTSTNAGSSSSSSSSSSSPSFLKNKELGYILASPSSLSPIASVPKEEVYNIASVLLQPPGGSSKGNTAVLPSSPIHTISNNFLSSSSSIIMNNTTTNSPTHYYNHSSSHSSSAVSSPQVVTIDLLGDSNFDEGDSTLLSPSPRK